MVSSSRSPPAAQRTVPRRPLALGLVGQLPPGGEFGAALAAFGGQSAGRDRLLGGADDGQPAAGQPGERQRCLVGQPVGAAFAGRQSDFGQAGAVLTVLRNVIKVGRQDGLVDVPIPTDLGFAWRPDKPTFPEWPWPRRCKSFLPQVPQEGGGVLVEGFGEVEVVAVFHAA
jgi:hypothetical protein